MYKSQRPVRDINVPIVESYSVMLAQEKMLPDFVAESATTKSSSMVGMN
jgi:hypothetical protein